MASRTLVEYVDDLDGTASADIAPVEFGLDGVTYEIDLNEANANALRGVLAAYIEAGRRTGGRKHRAGTATAQPTRSREQTKAIREWALKNGHDVSERGRIPAAVIDAYDSAHRAHTAASAKSRVKSHARKR